MKEIFSFNHPKLIDSSKAVFSWLILANVTGITIITIASLFGAFIAEPTIRGALMLSSDDQRWLSISFIMMLGIILPVANWWAERYGYKRIFFIGFVIFILGSLLDACAFNFLSFLISRIIAGLGAGIVLLLSVPIISFAFPKERLTFAIALYIGISFGMGAAGGCLLAGYAAQYLSWQAFFFLCFFLSLPFLPTTWLLHQETEKDEHKFFDTWGYAAFILFLTNILIILSSGKAAWNTGGWSSPVITVCSILAALGLIALILIELKHPHPLIVLHLFKNTPLLLGCIAVFFVNGISNATFILAPFVFFSNLNYEIHTIGLILSMLGITWGISSALVAFISKKINAHVLTILGMSILAISCWMNQDITLYSSHGQMFTLLNLRMIGVALSLGPATALALSRVPQAWIGAASFLIIFFRQIGGTIVSLIADVITIERTVFHKETFGTQILPLDPPFQEVARHLKQHLVHHLGKSQETAQIQAPSIIRENILAQSSVTAVNDAFVFLGIIVSVITFFLFLQLLFSFKKKHIKNHN